MSYSQYLPFFYSKTESLYYVKVTLYSVICVNIYKQSEQLTSRYKNNDLL